MKDNAITPERKAQIVQHIATLVTMTKAIVDTIHDLGPTPTQIVYAALVDHGLVDAASFDRFMQLAEATGSVKRDGLVIRPATREEQRDHDLRMFKEIRQLAAEVAARQEEADKRVR